MVASEYSYVEITNIPRQLTNQVSEMTSINFSLWEET